MRKSKWIPEAVVDISSSQCYLYAARANGRTAAVALPRTSPSPPAAFIGLVYNQFEWIKIKNKK
jgi:hypothetical protein